MDKPSILIDAWLYFAVFISGRGVKDQAINKRQNAYSQKEFGRITARGMTLPQPRVSILGSFNFLTNTQAYATYFETSRTGISCADDKFTRRLPGRTRVEKSGHLSRPRTYINRARVLGPYS